MRSLQGEDFADLGTQLGGQLGETCCRSTGHERLGNWAQTQVQERPFLWGSWVGCAAGCVGPWAAVVVVGDRVFPW